MNNIGHTKNTNNTAKVFSISNHKGGVGKTTSAVNIGAGLALKGKKVLLVDLDPQANLSQCLGIGNPSISIYHALKGDNELPIYQVSDNLFVVPSSLDLAASEVELSARIMRETILKKIIDPIRPDYDFIIIDCPPSLGLITINAFASSDEIYIPLQSQFLALHGLDKLTDIIALVRENINAELKVGGVFITQYDSRKVLNRDIVASVKGTFKEGEVLNTIIRDNVSLAEAPIKGIPIFSYDPKSNGAKDYEELVNEILTRQLHIEKML